MKYLLIALIPFLIFSCGVDKQNKAEDQEDFLERTSYFEGEKEFLESIENSKARSAPQPEVVALNNQTHLIILGLGAYMDNITSCSNRPATIADFQTIQAITSQIEVLDDSIGVLATGRNLMIHNFYKTHLQYQFDDMQDKAQKGLDLLNSSETCEQIENRLINGRLRLIKNSHARLLYASNTKKRLYK